MTKQNKKSDDIVQDEIIDEIIRDKIREAFSDNPDNPMVALEEAGFTWYDDDYPSEEAEEDSAVPENRNQEVILEFFQSGGTPSDYILEIFLAEKSSDTPNFPLFRRYFRKANRNLKSLILWGLEKYPARIDLLQDLGFFHEFSNILNTVIKYYTHACENQANIDTFTDLAQEFYYTTLPDGYDAYLALKDLFPEGTEKRAIVDFLIAEEGKEDGGIYKDYH